MTDRILTHIFKLKWLAMIPDVVGLLVGLGNGLSISGQLLPQFKPFRRTWVWLVAYVISLIVWNLALSRLVPGRWVLQVAPSKTALQNLMLLPPFLPTLVCGLRWGRGGKAE